MFASAQFGDHDDPSPSAVEPSLSSLAPSSLPALLALYPVPSYAFNLSASQSPSAHSVVAPPSSRYEVRLSFGVGGAYSGTPFHFHSSVFAHVVHGRKRWFLYPPSSSWREPPPSTILRPDLSALQWANAVYGVEGALDEGGVGERLQECVCEAGDVLYVPDGWMHATLNLELSVFVSMFIRDKGADWEDAERRWRDRYGAN